MRTLKHWRTEKLKTDYCIGENKRYTLWRCIMNAQNVESAIAFWGNLENQKRKDKMMSIVLPHKSMFDSTIFLLMCFAL